MAGSGGACEDVTRGAELAKKTRIFDSKCAGLPGPSQFLAHEVLPSAQSPLTVQRVTFFPLNLHTNPLEAQALCLLRILRVMEI